MILTDIKVGESCHLEGLGLVKRLEDEGRYQRILYNGRAGTIYTQVECTPIK